MESPVGWIRFGKSEPEPPVFLMVKTMVKAMVSGYPPYISNPIGSMYAIYGNIYHQYTINIPPMLAYIPYMDPMGMVKTHGFRSKPIFP